MECTIIDINLWHASRPKMIDYYSFMFALTCMHDYMYTFIIFQSYQSIIAVSSPFVKNTIAKQKSSTFVQYVLSQFYRSNSCYIILSMSSFYIHLRFFSLQVMIDFVKHHYAKGIAESIALYKSSMLKKNYMVFKWSNWTVMTMTNMQAF